VGWRPVRRVAPVFVAASIVVIAAVAASERGWVWAVVAWMGSSAVSFAISVVVANRRALTSEEDERQLLQAALDQKSESGVRSSSECSIPFTDPPDTAAACASGGPDGELCVQVEGAGASVAVIPFAAAGAAREKGGFRMRPGGENTSGRAVNEGMRPGPYP
jgi:hypothetical protein